MQDKHASAGRRVFFGIILVCFFAALFLGVINLSSRIKIERNQKNYGGYRLAVDKKDIPIESFLSGILLTGFRGVVADLLWLKCDHYWHTGQWYKLMPMYYFIGRLQPEFVTVWVVGGWHMAYNISYKAAHQAGLTQAQRDAENTKWIDYGIQFLKEGLTYNTHRYEVYFELAWVYLNKIKDYKTALEYLEKAVLYEHPQLVDRILAHTYEECGMYKEAYKLWQKILLENKGKDGPATRFIAELKEKIRNGG